MERRILRESRHRHVITYLGVEQQPKVFRMFTEYAPGGTLRSLLTRFGRLSEDVVARYTRHILSGLAHLHSCSVVHGSLSCDSALLSGSGTVKITGFGSAARLRLTTASGKVKLSRKVDTWAVGAMALQMLLGNPALSIPCPDEATQSAQAEDTGSTSSGSPRDQQSSQSGSTLRLGGPPQEAAGAGGSMPSPLPAIRAPQSEEGESHTLARESSVDQDPPQRASTPVADAPGRSATTGGLPPRSHRTPRASLPPKGMAKVRSLSMFPGPAPLGPVNLPDLRRIASLPPQDASTASTPDSERSAVLIDLSKRLPPMTSPELQHFLSRCLTPVPRVRAPVSELLSHPFIRRGRLPRADVLAMGREVPVVSSAVLPQNGRGRRRSVGGGGATPLFVSGAQTRFSLGTGSPWARELSLTSYRVQATPRELEDPGQEDADLSAVDAECMPVPAAASDLGSIPQETIEAEWRAALSTSAAAERAAWDQETRRTLAALREVPGSLVPSPVTTAGSRGPLGSVSGQRISGISALSQPSGFGSQLPTAGASGIFASLSVSVAGTPTALRSPVAVQRRAAQTVRLTNANGSSFLLPVDTVLTPADITDAGATTAVDAYEEPGEEYNPIVWARQQWFEWMDRLGQARTAISHAAQGDFHLADNFLVDSRHRGALLAFAFELMVREGWPGEVPIGHARMMLQNATIWVRQASTADHLSPLSIASGTDMSARPLRTASSAGTSKARAFLRAVTILGGQGDSPPRAPVSAHSGASAFDTKNDLQKSPTASVHMESPPASTTHGSHVDLAEGFLSKEDWAALQGTGLSISLDMAGLSALLDSVDEEVVDGDGMQEAMHTMVSAAQGTEYETEEGAYRVALAAKRGGWDAFDPQLDRNKAWNKEFEEQQAILRASAKDDQGRTREQRAFMQRLATRAVPDAPPSKGGRAPSSDVTTLAEEDSDDSDYSTGSRGFVGPPSRVTLQSHARPGTEPASTSPMLATGLQQATRPSAAKLTPLKARRSGTGTQPRGASQPTSWWRRFTACFQGHRRVHATHPSNAPQLPTAPPSPSPPSQAPQVGHLFPNIRDSSSDIALSGAGSPRYSRRKHSMVTFSHSKLSSGPNKRSSLLSDESKPFVAGRPWSSITTRVRRRTVAVGKPHSTKNLLSPSSRALLDPWYDLSTLHRRGVKDVLRSTAIIQAARQASKVIGGPSYAPPQPRVPTFKRPPQFLALTVSTSNPVDGAVQLAFGSSAHNLATHALGGRLLTEGHLVTHSAACSTLSSLSSAQPTPILEAGTPDLSISPPSRLQSPERLAYPGARDTTVASPTSSDGVPLAEAGLFTPASAASTTIWSAPGCESVSVQRPYFARSPTELHVVPGDIVSVLRQDGVGWSMVRLQQPATIPMSELVGLLPSLDQSQTGLPARWSKLSDLPLHVRDRILVAFDAPCGKPVTKGDWTQRPLHLTWTLVLDRTHAVDKVGWVPSAVLSHPGFHIAAPGLTGALGECWSWVPPAGQWQRLINGKTQCSSDPFEHMSAHPTTSTATSGDSPRSFSVEHGALEPASLSTEARGVLNDIAARTPGAAPSYSYTLQTTDSMRSALLALGESAWNLALTRSGSSDDTPAQHGVQSKALGEYVRAVTHFSASRDDEVDLDVGDVVWVWDKGSSGWWEGRNMHSAVDGRFPGTCTRPMSTHSTPLPHQPSTTPAEGMASFSRLLRQATTGRRGSLLQPG